MFKLLFIIGLIFPLQDSLDMTNIVSADIQRKDVGKDVRIIVTLNLMDGMKYSSDFFLNDDTDKFKNGTTQERNIIRKKYIRRTIKNYLDSLAAPPSTEVDRGTNTVPKANFTDPDDIGK